MVLAIQPLFLPNNYYWLFPIVENVSLKVNLHYFSILDSYNKTCLFGASCIFTFSRPHLSHSGLPKFRSVTGGVGQLGPIAPSHQILAE